MKRWFYMAHMSVNQLINWLNKCIQHVIQVDEVWQIRCYGLGNTLVLKTMDTVAIKESK